MVTGVHEGTPNGETSREGLMSSPRWVWGLLGLMVLVGAYFRIKTATAPVVADELSTLWISRDRSLGEVLDIVYSDAEISPPLYFMLAWLVGKFSSVPELIRLPSLIAGISAIPLTYAIGTRMIGRIGGLVAAATVTLSPFLVFYSANARGYSVAITMVLLSTLGLLLATQTGRRRWWVLYGAGSLLALYSHYTMAFVLIGQLVWVLWAHPAARKPAFVTNVIAAVFYLPWIAGFIADNGAITVPILEALQGDGLRAKVDAVEQLLFFRVFSGAWSLGRPADVLLLICGALVAIAGVASAWLVTKTPPKLPGMKKRGLFLVLALTFSTGIGEGLLLLTGTDLFGARNLAATWVGLPFLVGIAVGLNRRYWAVASASLLIAGFAYGTLRIADPVQSAYPYREASEYAGAAAGPSGAVIDSAHFTPCPLGSVEVYLPSSVDLYKPGLPAIDDVDFIKSILVPNETQTVVDEAFAGPGPVAVVTLGGPELVTDTQFEHNRTGGPMSVPEGWQVVDQKVFDGETDLTVSTYERKGADE